MSMVIIYASKNSSKCLKVFIFNNVLMPNLLMI